MANQALVAGVGMLSFTKPGQPLPYEEMGAAATRIALQHNPGLGGASAVTLSEQRA